MTAGDFTLRAGAPAVEIRDRYDRHGIVIVKGALPADAIARQVVAINALLAIRLESLGHKPAGEIDVDMNTLLRIDRQHAMDIIRAIKDSPFFFAVLADGRLHAICKACLGCETLLSVHDIAQFRIDPPDDDVRNFDWHQDFQYNVTSLNAATVWYPLTPITPDMGPLVVAPGSHRTMLPVTMDDGGHKSGAGTAHAVLRLQIDRQEAESQAVMLDEVEVGDVVVFHSLLVHRSSANRSTRSRWTMNPRFCDAADRDFSKRGWVAVRDKTPGLFARLYPDYVRTSH